MSMIIFLAGLVLSIPLAHLIAWLLTRSRRVSPGNVHEIMPVLPASRPIRGSAERRWNAQINRTEAALIRRFSNGVQGAEATQLAGQLGIDAEVVEEALAKLREEIPCRLRITAQGRMLHDFEAKDISTLQARRARSWPLRALIFVLAAFANIGAAWPVIGLGLGAALTLLAMFSGPEEERLIVGLTGLFLLAVFFVVNLIAGWVIHLVLTPVLISGPRLGDLTESEEPRKRTRRSASNTGGGGGGGLWFWGGDVAANSWGRSSSSGGGSWFSGGGSSSSSGGDSDGDGIGEAILVIIVVVVLLMIIAATATVFVVWLRGLWRSLTRREEAGDISPSDWVRMADTIDWSERYLPTNDLVLRTSRALGRTFRHRRPQDTDMGARALLLAKRHNGVVSALDLVLYEGLDQSEAIELGVRLCALAQGQIRMTDEGDMAFAFPARILGDLEGTLSDDMEAEYIDLKADHTWARRPHQPEGRAPVNVVGLTRGHLVASDRLVAGTFSMAAIGVLTLAGVEAHVVLQLLGGAGLTLMATSTAVLSATARYAARACAFEGMLRDVRRGLLVALRRAVRSNASTVSFGAAAQAIEVGYGTLWKVPEPFVTAEITHIAADLDLDPVAPSPQSDPHLYDIQTFSNRFHRLRAGLHELTFDDALELPTTSEADEVIFDTAVEHEQVRVLA